MFVRPIARLLAAALLAAPVPALAQQMDRIAAVVNDEAITMRDLEQRVVMAVVMSRLPDNLEVRRRVLQQVLRKMIEEKLQLQEAKRMKIVLSTKDIDDGIANIERQNGAAKGSMLKELQAAGVDAGAVRSQINAGLAWAKLINGRMRPQVRIGDEEVTDRLETIKDRQGKPEYLTSEIFLPVDNPSQDEQARTLGERLIEQLGQGAPFQVLARQFSQAPTAANGGSMGWVSEGMIDDEALRALEKVAPGRITPLLRAADGYHIYGLATRRIAGADVDADSVATVAQLTLPGPVNEALEAKAQQIAEPAQSAQSCDVFEAKGRAVGAHGISRVGPGRLQDLPPITARIAANVPAGRIAPPVKVPEGMQLMMVCSITSTPKLPSREQVRADIEEERLDMLARRYQRDLYRAAFIDVRL
jgi:peptidyl-prolyl cis-trans isomerase SurA